MDWQEKFNEVLADCEAVFISQLQVSEQRGWLPGERELAERVANNEMHMRLLGSPTCDYPLISAAEALMNVRALAKEGEEQSPLRKKWRFLQTSYSSTQTTTGNGWSFWKNTIFAKKKADIFTSNLVDIKGRDLYGSRLFSCLNFGK